ncbi:MAG: AAA family ATPase, partial [Bacteroidetes bacterium]|nr:AAA family ATPase [Bacteroidota bacterium]
MITRIKEREVQSLLKQFLVVALIGPRQCGKTTIAKKSRSDKKITSLYFDLESPADFSRFADPEYFLQSIDAHRIIIDEVQRKPELFSILRPIVDKNKKKGKYLL